MSAASILCFARMAFPLLLAGCAEAKPLPPVGAGSARGGAPAMTVSEARVEVGRLVNEHRARQGCPPLAWDDAAAGIAQAHSEDMARRNFFSHTSSDGRTLADRLRSAGIEYAGAAENIAFGQPTADEVVRGWLSSAGHRQNIENCAFTRQGVGLSAGRWTHDFYVPLR